ncbi:MAG TPA: SurA N-terminal domain-containing protein, partial [Gammaproteobacteria bacterium]|nr:SurA N-terminal domain-containing protein [Gammaproteobacteria bacterium]
MLQKIRDKSQGWFAWVVIGLIALTFILIGTGTYFGSEPNDVLAKVNGQEITQADVNQYYERLLLQQGSNSSNFDAKQIKQYALEVLMQEAALKATAKEKGLRVSKDQILQVIAQDNNFYDKGEFSNEKYHQLLAQNYFTPQQYQDLIEFQFLIAQLQHGLMQTNFSLKNELNTLFKFLDQKRNFTYHIVNHKEFLNQVSVNDQEIKEYYDAHRDQFMTEEQIKIQYLELNTKDLKKDISYTESDLEQFYQDKIDLYTEPQKIKVAHILVAFDAQDAKAKDAAIAKINNIKTKLSQGESFAKVAQQYSDDKLSAKNGGELSWITQGEAALIADFEKAAFAMKEVN